MPKAKKPTGIYYGDYLRLPTLLDCQHPESKKTRKGECHDEMLFIIVHQVYELWFKQIIHEMKAVIKIFNQNYIPEGQLAQAVSALERIIKIQDLLLKQIDVLETMTPMDFLEFRHLLVPASGFQSIQFREVEIRLGLSTSKRFRVDRHYFLGRLSPKDRKYLEKVELQPTLLTLLENWLLRMPFTFVQTEKSKDSFDFWSAYQKSVQTMLKQEELIVEQVPHFRPDEKEAQRQNVLSTKQTFDTLFNKDLYNKLKRKGERRLSQKALLNGLFILLYRDAPILHMPYRFLRALLDIDENFTTWRYRHALLAKRMLGTKVGTGGSSGHVYLKNAADHNRVFEDLFNLSTFLIPRHLLPTLPQLVQSKMDFHFTRKAKGE